MENILTNFTNSKLEFDRILQEISTFTLSESGKDYIININPGTDFDKIVHEHLILNQLKKFFQNEENLSINIIYIFEKQLIQSLKNIVLSCQSLYELASSVDLYFNLKKKFDNPKYPELRKLFNVFNIDNNFYKTILKYFDHEGKISSLISNELKSIRNNINEIQLKMRKTSEAFLKNAKNLDYLTDEIISERDGLYCIPIKINFKNRVDGIVIDSSSSGQTVFITPLKVIEHHNELIMLYEDEKKEIKRILIEFTEIIKNNYDILKIINNDLLYFDILYAKTKYSMINNYNSPEIIKERKIKILDGRHPMLGSCAVPLDLTIGDDFRILVITGPNTGGKTVVLKTIGLFILMIQSGIPIPCSSTSQFCIFEKLFIDIGDEQSIEQSLSTFSGHIKRIIEIINNSGDYSLALIDEFGTGTDPIEGSCMAMSILLKLLEKKTIALMTTHYSAIKHFVSQTENAENGSMEFDNEKLIPTYKLKIGIAGSSKAFEISKRIGMPIEIIEKAKSFIDKDYMNLEILASKLEQRQIELDNKINQLNEFESRLNEKENRLKEKNEEITKKENQLKDLFKIKESEFLRKSRKEFENIIKQIKTTNASKDTIKQGKEILKKIDENININNVKDNKKQNKFNTGDDVFIISKNLKGIIIDKTNISSEYLVKVGLLKINFPSNDLELIKTEKKEEYNYSVEKKSKIQLTLDLRGTRYHEAEKKIEKFIEESLLNHIKTIKIIHGMGTGALRKCIHEHLEHSPFVENFNYEKNINKDSTNFGVTIVNLK